MKKLTNHFKTALTYFFIVSLGFNCNNSSNKTEEIPPFDAARNEIAQKYLTAGILKADKKLYNEAILEFNKALKEDPYFSEVYSSRAEARYYANDLDGALEDCDRAVELSPNKERVFVARGNLKVVLKKYDEAIEDYSKCLELNPDRPQIYFGRAGIEFLNSQYARSLDDVNESLRRQPNNGEAYYLRWKLGKVLGDKNKACNDMLKAIKLGIKIPTEEMNYCNE